MHCERCNVDFPEGLRYCKWCGGPLKERSRDTSELKTCPSCKAAVKSSWVFCKSCGARLRASETVSTAPVGSAAPGPSLCSNCGEQVDAGSLYCKGCGSPVQQAPYAQSSLLCAACNSYSPIGSPACIVCGAPFAGPPPPGTERSRDTLVDVEETSIMQSDPGPRLSQPGRPAQGTVEMASRPGVGLPGDEQATRAISSYEPAERIEAGPATGSGNPDSLKTTVMESEAIAINTGEVGSARSSADVRDADQARTSSIQDGIETLIAPSVETTILDQGRTTSPVEGEGAEGGSPETATMPISDSEAHIGVTGQNLGQTEQPVGSDGTDPLGATPPAADEVWPESLAGSTVIIGSGTAAPPPPAPDSFSEAITRIDQPAPPPHDPQTAPFGLDPSQPQQGTVPITEQPWQQHQNMPAPVEAPETRVMPIPPQHMPLARKPANVIAIASVVVGAVIVVGALIAFWWYFAGGRPEPARQEEVVVEPPAAEPPPTAPPPEVKPPPVPEGMALVPGGRYIIGRDDGDALARPQQTVEVRPFYIDLTEVTNAQYMLFVDAQRRQPPADWAGGTFPEDRANWPVTGVTWQDAADYAAWAGKRLPTEIEWEAAARGAEGRIFPWGNEWRRGLANVGTRGIREVGQYREGASPFGPLDMLGNVWEWTADELTLYPGSTAQLPSSLEPGVTYRVIRGGAYDGSKDIDASYRGFVDAGKGYPKTGFRCVKDIN